MVLKVTGSNPVIRLLIKFTDSKKVVKALKEYLSIKILNGRFITKYYKE